MIVYNGCAKKKKLSNTNHLNDTKESPKLDAPLFEPK